MAQKAPAVQLCFPAWDHPVYYKDRCHYVCQYLKRVHNIEAEFSAVSQDDLQKPDESLPLAASCVIALGVELLPNFSQRKLQNMLVHHDSSIFNCLDDKAKMVDFPFVDADSPNFVPQIPTVDLTTATESDVEEFLASTNVEEMLLKPTAGVSSAGHRSTSREELCSEVGKPFVAQPLLREHQTLSMCFCAVQGELKGWSGSRYAEGLSQDLYYSESFSTVLHQQSPFVPEILRFVREFVATHEVSGIMELEFLLSAGNLYLLEVNPRLSGQIKNVDRRGMSPYIERLVVPYLQHFGLAVEGKKQFHLFDGETLLMLPLGKAFQAWNALQECRATSRMHPSPSFNNLMSLAESVEPPELKI